MLTDAIELERALLGALREVSTVIDTSQLRPAQLRRWYPGAGVALLDAPGDVVAGGTLLLSLTTGGGGISSTDLTNGTITLNVPDFALAAGSYVYDLIRISGSVREYLCGGKFTARAGVTA